MPKPVSPCSRPREILKCSGLRRDGVRITDPHDVWSEELPHIKSYCERGAKRCRNYLCKACLKVSNTLHAQHVRSGTADVPERRRCTLCGVTKPASDFRRDAARRTGLHPHCKPCVTLTYPWRNNPEPKYRAKRKRRAAGLGLPSEPYTRKEILALRGNLCHICGEEPEKLHLDHLIPLQASPETLVMFGIDQHPGNVIANIDVACASCNYSKGARVSQHDVDLWRSRWA